MTFGVLLATATCGTAALAAAGWGLAGPAGLLAAGICVTVSAVLLLRWRQVPARPRLSDRATRGKPFVNKEFARYRRIAGATSWGQVSERHFDHSFRPLLERVTAAVLMDRRGIDTATDAQAARELLGPRLWALADPRCPRSDDSRARPPSPADVDRLLSRLEEL